MQHLPTHPRLCHPLTGEPLRALGFTKRGPIWPIMGASEPAPEADPPGDPAPEPTPEPDPKPEDALGDAGKKALDKERADRKAAEKRAKDAESELEKFREASKTEQEKALDAARKEGQAEALKTTAPRLVAAEFRAALAGRRTADEVAELIEDLDLSKYLTEAGEVDAERVTKKADLLAPAGEERKTAPSFGGGARGKTEPTQAGSLGEAIKAKLANPTR